MRMHPHLLPGCIQQQDRVWLRKSLALGVVLEDGAKLAATSFWLEVGMHIRGQGIHEEDTQGGWWDMLEAGR